jgi:DNA-binding response OmpR family regulator
MQPRSSRQRTNASFFSSLDTGHLSRSEYATFEALRDAAGGVVSAAQILRAAKSGAYPEVVYQWITAVRKKMPQVTIKTHHGRGYSMETA